LNNKDTINFDLEVVLMTSEQIHDDTQKYYKLIQEILVKESQILMKRANSEKKKPVEVRLHQKQFQITNHFFLIRKCYNEGKKNMFGPMKHYCRLIP
jgi:hypothetical protein